jgi:membrane-bound serine protease (ClpP class)
VLCVIAARYLPKMPVASRLVLAKAPLGVAAAHSEQSAIERIRPGDLGVAESLCRPAGKARFGQEIIDVMSEGEYLRPGTPLVVVRNEGNRLVVRPEKQA